MTEQYKAATVPCVRCGFERRTGGGGKRTGLCAMCRAVLTKSERAYWTTGAVHA